MELSNFGRSYYHDLLPYRRTVERGNRLRDLRAGWGAAEGTLPLGSRGRQVWGSRHRGEGVFPILPEPGSGGCLSPTGPVGTLPLP